MWKAISFLFLALLFLVGCDENSGSSDPFTGDDAFVAEGDILSPETTSALDVEPSNDSVSSPDTDPATPDVFQPQSCDDVDLPFLDGDHVQCYSAEPCTISWYWDANKHKCFATCPPVWEDGKPVVLIANQCHQ